MGKNARLKRERKFLSKSANTEAHSTLGDSPCEASSINDRTAEDLPPPSLSALALHVSLLTLLTFVTSIFPIESEDIFANIVTGEYIWTHRTIPDVDPFSFTGPHRWRIYTALPSLVFFWVHTLGGLPGIQIFCAGLLATTYAILYVVWTRRTRRPLFVFIVMATTVLASCYWAQTRIYLFAYLFTAISLLLITSPNPRAIWRTIPLQVIWINCHPSAILGIVLVGLWFLVNTWSKGRPLKESSTVVALVAAATSLSPIGPYAFVKFAEESFGEHPSRANIFEWFSPFSPAVSGQHLAWWFFCACAVFALTLVFVFLSRAKVRSAGILIPLSLAFFYLAIGCARHIPLFYFALSGLLICVGEAIAKTSRFALFHRGSMRAHIAACAIALAITAKVGFLGYANGNTERKLSFGIDRHKFPDNPIEILKRHNIDGNVISDYDTGSYFLYRMYPEYKVYIDGARLDEVYGEEGFLRYMKLGNDQSVIDEEISKYDVRAFIIPLPPSKDDIVRLHTFLSSDPQWGLAYFDDTSMLFIKRDEAARKGVPVFSYLSPFTGADEVIKSTSDGVAALERDFELGESINPNSIAFLTMKTRFLKTRGLKDLAAQSARRMVTLCKEIDRSKLCRENAQRQLMGMGQFGLARELQ